MLINIQLFQSFCGWNRGNIDKNEHVICIMNNEIEFSIFFWKCGVLFQEKKSEKTQECRIYSKIAIWLAGGKFLTYVTTEWVWNVNYVMILVYLELRTLC